VAEQESNSRYQLIGLPFPGLTTTQLASALVISGADILAISDTQVKYEIDSDQVEQILACPALMYTEAAPGIPVAEGLDGSCNSRIHSINQGPGQGWDGTGEYIAIGDDGLFNHEDFRGRRVNHTSVDYGSHGEMTGGKACGAGNLDPAGVGVAPGATVHIFNINNYEHIGNAVTNFLQYGIAITSTSFGEGCGNPYDVQTAEIDAQVHGRPELCHVFSAGNRGTSPCNNIYGYLGQDYAGNFFATITGGRKAGKNVIAVGNNFSNDDLASSSSLGPARDGRTKPDLCANGQGDYTTDDGNTYRLSSGTSAAAPTVAGALACLSQYYRAQYGTTPPSALLKPLLLNTADDLGLAGPDFRYGYGRINARKALRVLQNGNYFSGTAAHGQQLSFQLAVPPGAQQVKVMLYWHDPAGSVLSARALVNDLDLKLQAPNGSFRLPLRPDASTNLSTLNLPATEGIDRINNVEQVVLNQPTPGYYNIRIEGYQIPQGPQDFYVVYEVEMEEMVVTYPSEGSTFLAGTIGKIAWDAVGNTGTFGVDVSLDGGQSWQILNNNISAKARQVQWTLPNLSTTQLKARVRRNGRTATSAGQAIIAPEPSFSVQSHGVNQGHIQWDPIPGAVAYEVFQLGEKYMESLGTTPNLEYNFPAQTGVGYWLSVRARFADGRVGRRAVAQYYEHFSCDQNLTLNLQFDNFPGQTAWFILDADGNVMQSGGPYITALPFSTRQETTCLPEGCFTLVMTDANSNGMCCTSGSGSFALTNDQGTILASGGQFGSINYDLFCVDDAPVSPLYATITTVQVPDCQEPNNGLLAANVGGGSGNYTYQWSNGSTSSTIGNLPAGTYSVTVNDGSQSQTAAVTLAVPVPIQAQITTQPAYCDDGRITLQLSGGLPPYRVTWNDGATATQRTDLAAGNYFVAVQDENNCLFTQWITVPEGTPLNVQLSGQSPTCIQANSGSINALVSGGSGIYQLQWSNGAQGTTVLSGLGSGTYSLTVTDGNCQTQQTFTLLAPTGFALFAQSTPPSCADANNGFIQLVTSGGVAPFVYTWSDGGTGAIRTALSAGVYLATVTDALGCQVVRAVPIVAPTALNLETQMIPANASTAGSINLTISGGTTPYQVLWSNGATSNYISGLAPGNYSVTVTDHNGCTSSTSVDVTYNEPGGGGQEQEYCLAQGASTTYEWIDRIVHNGQPYYSGNDDGYGDYTSTIIPIHPGIIQTLTLVPGYTSTFYREYWRVWIDFNADGDFDDPGEEVITTGGVFGSTTGTFTAPGNATGTTRMRIMMRYGSPPQACDNPSYGEVEDYTIQWETNAVDYLSSSPSAHPAENTIITEKTTNSNYISTTSTWQVYPNPTNDFIYLNGKLDQDQTAQVLLYNTAGQLLHQQTLREGQARTNNRLSLVGYPAGIYWIHVQTVHDLEVIPVVRE
ncbi:MAG: S8 family serine peptidase, partial [Bacteroidota bacterium]